MRYRAAGWRCEIALTVIIAIVCALPAAAGNTTVLVRITIEHVHATSKADSNKDVVVWLDRLDGNIDPAASSSQHKLRMTQRDKQFHPHVLAVPVGSAVEFPNEDPFFHNVFSLYEGKRFDLGLYEAGSSRTVHFDRPGVSFIFCNIHPEMNAYVLALGSPYFAVSDAKGEIRIPDVAPGRYRLRVWYERAESGELARLSRDISVNGPVVNVGTLGVSESARLIPQHTNKHGREYDIDRVPYPE